VVGVVLVTTLLSACTGAERSQPPPSPVPSATADPQATVEGIGLTEADLPEGTEVALIPRGAVVAGEATLDECGFDFTSEELRRARRQVDIAYAGDPARYSNEVVAYGSAADAELAMREWRTAVRSCPGDRFVASAVGGIPAVRTELLEFHKISTLPVTNNAVARQLLTTRKGASAYVAVVYQQQGPVLSGSYLTTDGQPSPEQVARLTHEAEATGQRLAALPSGSQA
jgi:hypothetical protein